MPFLSLRPLGVRNRSLTCLHVRLFDAMGRAMGYVLMKCCKRSFLLRLLYVSGDFAWVPALQFWISCRP